MHQQYLQQQTQPEGGRASEQIDDGGDDDDDRVIRLFSTVAKVNAWNLECRLRVCKKACASIEAVHSGVGAASARSDEAGGLEPIVQLGRGARVMLRVNVNTRLGLVNGARGTLEELVFAPNTAPPKLPIAAIIRFDSYSGDSLPDGCVPIIPVTRKWVGPSGGIKSRKQLPLDLAWAITVHKSQGMTLDRAVIDIGKRDFSAGLSFVALSRVRTLSGLRLALFDKTRWKQGGITRVVSEEE